jgi:hypothetical protein
MRRIVTMLLVAATVAQSGCMWIERTFFSVTPIQGANIVYGRHDAEGNVIERSPPAYDKNGKFSSPFDDKPDAITPVPFTVEK